MSAERIAILSWRFWLYFQSALTRSLPSLSTTARIALQLCLQRRQVNAEVFRDPLDRRTRFAVPRDAHDVVRELTRIGLTHDVISAGHPPGQARPDNTYPCSKPERESTTCVQRVLGRLTFEILTDHLRSAFGYFEH